ncbi:hypothetical protein KXR64_22780 [Brucella intermedia]|uniref:ATP-grasp domain-containing protein n=1 Tax=Brucella TaxID=234 RepID=UPI0011151730|nr:hypothetical protein [Brucella intermedia]
MTLYDVGFWSKLIPENTVLFTAAGFDLATRFNGVFDIVQEFDEYEHSDEPIQAAIKLHGEAAFKHIISVSEMDVERASYLRCRLGIEGMPLNDALAFRDKVLMKTLASQQGLRVPQFKALRFASDLSSFTEKHGFPVVLKPKDGKGSLDVRVLRTEEETFQVLEASKACPLGDRWQIEEFVEGTMYRVDGLVLEEAIDLIHIGRYTDSTLSFIAGKPIATLEVPKSESVVAKIAAFTRTLIECALPTPKNSLFHLQVFEDHRGDIVLCEVGCRLGGGAICDEVFYSTGVNILARYLAAELDCPEPPGLERMSDRLTGRMIVPSRGGLLKEVSSNCPIEGVQQYRVNGRKGCRYPPSVMTNAEMQSIIFTAQSYDELQSKYQELCEWVRATTVWEQDQKIMAAFV